MTPRHKRAAVVGVLLGLFLSALESTVVTTAMPTIVSHLGGLSIYSWVFSGYLL
jgi:MFS family permease